MAKFFKVLMSILLIVFIAALAALFVPPLLGITTVVSEPDKATNIQIGSVAYGTRESITELKSGESIIYNTDNETYIYEVTEVNSDDGTVSVRTSSNSSVKTIDLRRTASKLLFVVPFLGYISIALESMLGTIILILAAVLLVVLFIISDIVSRKAKKKKRAVAADDEYEEYEDNSDSSYFNDLSESRTKPSALDALQNQDESISASKKTDTDKTAEEVFRTQPSDFGTDTAATEIFKPVPSGGKSMTGEIEISLTEDTNDLSGRSSAFVDLKKAVSAGETAAAADDFSEKPVDEDMFVDEFEAAEKKPAVSHTDNIPDMRAALEAALNTAQVNRSNNFAPVKEIPAEEPAVEIPDEIELAIPVRSLESLLSEAYARGEDPKVIKDEASGVTFVDYSDYLK